MTHQTTLVRAFDGDPRHEHYIERTVQVGEENVRQGGRPFATIIVNNRTGEIVAEAGNQVKQTGDPTAHAEIVAIRVLSAKIGENFEGYTMYVLAHPCPMCLAACYYTSIDEVIYLTLREHYCDYYVDPRKYILFDEFYSEFGKNPQERRLPMTYVEYPPAIDVYRLWRHMNPIEGEQLESLSKQQKEKRDREKE
jgi:guanine deaminase